MKTVFQEVEAYPFWANDGQDLAIELTFDDNGYYVVINEKEAEKLVKQLQNILDNPKNVLDELQ